MTRNGFPAGFEPDLCPVFAHNELVIEASPEAVWEWLVRAPLWPRFYNNARRIVIESGPRDVLTPGARFRWITFGVPVSTVIEEFEPARRLAWRGTGLGASGYHFWDLEPRGAGACRVVTEETQRGLVPSLFRAPLRAGLRHFHQKWLEGLGAMAKGGRPEMGVVA